MKIAIPALVSAVFLGTTAFAGGPIVVVEEEEVIVEEEPASSKGLLPLLLIPVAICIVLCADEGNPPPG